MSLSFPVSVLFVDLEERHQEENRQNEKHLNEEHQEHAVHRSSPAAIGPNVQVKCHCTTVGTVGILALVTHAASEV